MPASNASCSLRWSTPPRGSTVSSSHSRTSRQDARVASSRDNRISSSYADLGCMAGGFGTAKKIVVHLLIEESNGRGIHSDDRAQRRRSAGSARSSPGGESAAGALPFARRRARPRASAYANRFGGKAHGLLLRGKGGDHPSAPLSHHHAPRR